MKIRQRILIPFTHGHSGSALLRRAGEIAASQEVELLVVSVLDTRSSFDSDGPAGGSLPGERAARLAPPEQKWLEQRPEAARPEPGECHGDLGRAAQRPVGADPQLVPRSGLVRRTYAPPAAGPFRPRRTGTDGHRAR